MGLFVCLLKVLHSCLLCFKSFKIAYYFNKKLFSQFYFCFFVSPREPKGQADPPKPRCTIVYLMPQRVLSHPANFKAPDPILPTATHRSARMVQPAADLVSQVPAKHAPRAPRRTPPPKPTGRPAFRAGRIVFLFYRPLRARGSKLVASVGACCRRMGAPL